MSNDISAAFQELTAEQHGKLLRERLAELDRGPAWLARHTGSSQAAAAAWAAGKNKPSGKWRKALIGVLGNYVAPELQAPESMSGSAALNLRDALVRVGLDELRQVMVMGEVVRHLAAQAMEAAERS